MDKSEQRKRGKGRGKANCLQAIDRSGSRSRPAILKKRVCGARERGVLNSF